MGASKTPFTDEEKIAMVHRWLAGESSTVIAKEANISPWSLHIWKKKFSLGSPEEGIPQDEGLAQVRRRRAGPRSRYTEQEQLMALRRIDNGESSSKVARELDVSDQTIYNWRSKFNARGESAVTMLESGLELDQTSHTPTSQITEEQKQEIARRVKAGETVRDLAHEFGVPINNVYLWNARINGLTSSEARESRGREARIVWTDEERIVLARKMADLRAADIEAPISRIFKEAQEAILDPNRIRTVAVIPPDIINLAQAAMDDTVASKSFPVIIEREIKPELNEDELLARVSTEKLFLFLLPRFTNVIGEIFKLVEERASSGKSPLTYPKMVEIEQHDTLKQRNIRLLVIGGMNIDQQDKLKSLCKEKSVDVDITFKSATYNPESLSQNFDYAIYCFIPYKEWWEKVKHKYISDRVFSVDRDDIDGVMAKILDIGNKERNPKAHTHNGTVRQPV